MRQSKRNKVFSLIFSVVLTTVSLAAETPIKHGFEIELMPPDQDPTIPDEEEEQPVAQTAPLPVAAKPGAPVVPVIAPVVAAPVAKKPPPVSIEGSGFAPSIDFSKNPKNRDE